MRRLQAHYSVGVIGVITDNAGHILVVEHVFHSPPRWGLPGGYANRHESPDESLSRELHEELMLTVRISDVVLIERNYGEHLDIAYACSAIGTVGTLSSELLGYAWRSPNDLPPMRGFHQRAVDRALLRYPDFAHKPSNLEGTRSS